MISFLNRKAFNTLITYNGSSKSSQKVHIIKKLKILCIKRNSYGDTIFHKVVEVLTYIHAAWYSCPTAWRQARLTSYPPGGLHVTKARQHDRHPLRSLTTSKPGHHTVPVLGLRVGGRVWLTACALSLKRHSYKDQIHTLNVTEQKLTNYPSITLLKKGIRNSNRCNFIIHFSVNG